jgi:hypothetical protein|tara:strand:- start:260 stop:478 length:219 start_codon:yes stop_codon:yes gene_type:complete
MSEMKQSITIDGVEHLLENLSDEQKNIIGHVQAADQEITRLNNLVAIVSTGRQAYINQLGEELNKKEDEFKD